MRGAELNNMWKDARSREAASARSRFAVSCTLSPKARKTRTTSSNVARQITRNAPATSRIRISRAPGPIVGTGFQSSSSSPRWTRWS
jgi:hypothetical protein